MTVQKHCVLYGGSVQYKYHYALRINVGIIMCMHSMFSIFNVFYIINDSESGPLSGL